MKLTNSGFQRGYNPIVVEGDASDMNMDFGELLMEKGDTVSYNEPKECIYVLVTLGGQGGDRGAQILLP